MGHSIWNEPNFIIFPRSPSQIFLKLFCQLLSIRYDGPENFSSYFESILILCQFKVSLNVALKLQKKTRLAKKWHFQRSFQEKTTFARCLEFCIMVFLQTNFKCFNIANFQNLSNPPYWILKTQKMQVLVGWSKIIVVIIGQIGKIQLSTILFSGNRPGRLVIDKHWAYSDSSGLL